MESRIAKRRKTALAIGGDDYIKRRNEFVHAAAEVFKEKGYAAANIGDVAAYLDVDRASLYYYVESKEELFHEVVREAAEQNAVRAEAIRDGEGSAEEKIRALIKSTVESYGEQPYLFVYIQEDMKRVAVGDSPWAKKMRSVNRRYDHAVLAIVQEGVDAASGGPTERGRLRPHRHGQLDASLVHTEERHERRNSWRDFRRHDSAWSDRLTIRNAEPVAPWSTTVLIPN
jgi:AcrR family transcriptional regulator